MELKIGDYVQAVSGCWARDVNAEGINTGVVIGFERMKDNVSVQFFRKFEEGHNCGGLGKDGHCYYINNYDLRIVKIKKNNMEVYE